MSLGTQMLPLSSAVKVFMFMSSFMLNISILKSNQVMKRLNWAVKVWPTSLMSEIARSSILTETFTFTGLPMSSTLKGGYSRT